MKSHQNLVKIVLILFITFFTPIIDENSLQASDLYKKNLGIATWANDTTLSGWQNNLGWKTHSKQYMKKYEIENNIKLFQVVSEPTRYGNTSFFIQAPGDGCYNRPSDCNRTNGERQKRVEAKYNKSFIGMVWVSYSFMIPNSYELNDTRKAIVQFHSDYDYYGPMFLLQLEDDGLIWTHESGAGHVIIPEGTDDCAAGSDKKNTHKRKYCEARMDSYQLIAGEQLERNVWYDLVFNINFDNKKLDRAFHKIWINGELVHERHNQTLWEYQSGLPKEFMKATFNFGIYGSTKDKSYQAIYADEVHFGRTCDKLLLDMLGYDCEQIQAQEINESEPFIIEDRAVYHTTGKVKYIKESPSWR
tara:strand:- start:231 stop:1310 length:1080 start_codon:yes stop_codon:yes gene_type:complete